MSTRAGSPPSAGVRVDGAAFRAHHARLRAGLSWGADDRRGALNHLTPARVAAAAGEVRTGRHVTMAARVQTTVRPDDPQPAEHTMVSPTGDGLSGPGVQFAMDRLAMNVHGNADSHLDAVCHVVFDGALYNGVSRETVTPEGVHALTVDDLADGVVGRGVLLDVPRVREVSWLEPGESVTRADLEAAEEAQGVQVGPGDLLFVRVGHAARRAALGPWDVAASRAGLHPAAVDFVADRRVALLGCDSNSDTAPSLVEGVGFPVHVLVVNALGVPLVDYLQFEDLAPLCAAEGRWSFLAVVAPLRLPAATGSPVNPVAVL